MIGIVIVAHGGLAREYLLAVEHVVGPQLGIVAVAIEDGPCMECLRTAHPVVSHDLAADAAHRWPRFAAGAAKGAFMRAGATHRGSRYHEKAGPF